MDEAEAGGDRTETEVTLVVACDDAAALLGRIAGLGELGGYRLVGGGTREFMDRYFDTDRNDLGRREYALRIREDGKTRSLTLKGPTRTDESGVQHRLEIEDDASSDSARIVFETLRMDGVLGRPPDDEASNGDTPEAILAARGLRPVHSRRIRRESRAVTAREGAIVAKMALDTVEFTLPRGVVVHREIEVESAGEGVAGHCSELARLLESSVSGLRPWRWSKLATGRMLHTLESEGVRVRNADGNVPADVYDEIERRLEGAAT